MKKVLAIVVVVAMVSAVASASTTLLVWTQLVNATYSGMDSKGTPILTYGGVAERGPNMALGYYGVQIWAEVLGNPNGYGIESMAVTLYTPDTRNAFMPVLNSTQYPAFQMKTLTTFSSDVFNRGYSCIPAKIGSFVNSLNPSAQRTGLDDNTQMTIGQGVSPVNTPILLATEAWNLVSLASPVTLGVYVASTSRYWDEAGVARNFDSITPTGMVIPEPVTMAMVSMGLCGLGMFIRRRVKETA